MALSTYSELKTSVAAWIRRTDLTATIPDFIALAEAQMNRQLRVLQMVGRATATISDEYGETPGDFAGVRTFHLETGPTVLKFIAPQAMDEMTASVTPSGRPLYYTVVGDSFRFFPAPDEDYTAELTYWQRIPALTDANPTNWLLTRHPDAYLYGALLQSAPYLKNDARMATWGELYRAALDGIQVASAVDEAAGLLTPIPSTTVV